MSYTRAHLAELGLTLWRSRDAAAEPDVVPAQLGEQAADAAPAAPVQPAAEPKQPERKPPEPDLRETQAVATRRDADEAEAARRKAIARMDWQALETHVKAQSRGDARQAVFGTGVRDARVMIIGEAPGADEDRQGEPFVGRAGQLLDQMLAAIGLSRSRDVYIANICKFRPPNNRDPRADEIAEDLPYLYRQIELVGPELLIAVGRVAAQSLLGIEDPIGRMRGKAHYFGEARLPVVVTYHPAYLLRSPREKAKSWVDLKRARSLLTVSA